MSRKADPRLNASLIREGRMIFQQLQQFFGDRKHATSFNDVMIAEAQAKAAKTPALKCGRCMAVTSDPKDAVTIINGTALCKSDANIVISAGK